MKFDVMDRTWVTEDACVVKYYMMTYLRILFVCLIIALRPVKSYVHVGRYLHLTGLLPGKNWVTAWHSEGPIVRGLSDPRTNRPSDYRAFGLLGPRNNGPSEYWTVTVFREFCSL